MQGYMSKITRLCVFFCACILGSTLAVAQAPRLFFTDLTSGPNTGGETVSGFSGAYVTIYGNFFGASQGTSTITWNGLNCLRVVGPVGTYGGWGSKFFWYQKIIVQLGSSCTPGAGSFVVTVNGNASNGLPFNVASSGKIFFVSTSGNDGNNGSFSSPFRTIPKCRNAINPGDVCYIRDGVTATSVDNFDSTLELESGGSGSTSPIAFVGYPGATATLGASGITYGLRVPNISVSANFVTIAELFFNNSDTGMNPTNSNNWRLVGNNFQCPNADGQTGCFETNEMSQVEFLGNETTNVGVPAANKQQHAVYFSSDTNHVEAAWNYIHDNRSCRAIQFHSSPLFGGGNGDPTGFNQFDLSVHDNLIHDDPCDGINFATVDPSKGKVEAYNNVIYHVGIGPTPNGGDSGDYSCIYMAYITNDGPDGQGTVDLYNNTLYDCGPFIGGFINNGNFNIAGGIPGLTARLRNNIMYQIGSEPFGSGGGWNSTYVSGSNNVVFSTGSPGAIPTFLTGNIRLDPRFANLSAFDFHLTAPSPAIDAGVTTNAATDLDGITRPQGAAFDIGAYEFFSPVTITILSSSANPAQLGQTATFTATVTAVASNSVPTGSVIFNDNGAPLAGAVSLNHGVATFSTSSLALGSHPITAAYSSNGGPFQPSTSNVLSQVINKDTTVTTITSSQSPVQVNTNITLTAGVSSVFGVTPTGNVTFVDTTTATTLGTASIGSPLSVSFAATGLHTITATYNSDGNHLTSSATFPQLVDGSGATPTTTALSYVLSPTQPNSHMNQQQVLFRHGIALSATVNPAPPASEQVIFMDGANVLGVASTNGTSAVSLAGQIALKAGSHSIYAHYFGDPTNAPSSAATMVINQSPRPR